jgi:hypothetical protein
MARVELDDLDGRSLARIYIAGQLTEARQVEDVLTTVGVSYVVTVEPVLRTLLGSSRNAAVFSVVADQAGYCVEQLAEAGLAIGIVPEDKRTDPASPTQT